jgi:hypothetical protein
MANALDADGVRIRRGSRCGRDVWLVGALGVIVVGATLVLHDRRPSPPELRDPPPVRAAAGTAGSAAPGSVEAPRGTEATREPSVPTTRAAKIRALRRAGVTPKPGPDGKLEYSAKDVIEALRAAGVHEGIAAFDPPGTKPIKPGLVVPDGWELPEGYVRYYQTTDDGKQLPPVLMFHPDYEFYDAQGTRIEVPADRIVPPELAPPGMPVHVLDVPGRDAEP